MERAFKNQKCIKVSLACVNNGFLVLKTEDKSFHKTATFLTSAIQPTKTAAWKLVPGPSVFAKN